MSVTPLPIPPTRNDPANFAQRADDFLAALPNFATELNDTANAVNNSEINSATAASNAASSAAAAGSSASLSATAAGAPQWVSGTTYALGATAWSPLTFFVYRRIVAGAGTTDPSNDPANWRLAGSNELQLVIVSGSSQSVVSGGRFVITNSAATTLTLPANPNVGDVVGILVANDRIDNVVARNGRLIQGLAEDLTIGNRYFSGALVFTGNTFGWRLTSLTGGTSIAPPNPVTHSAAWAMGTGFLSAWNRISTTVNCPGAVVGDLSPLVSTSSVLPAGVILNAVVTAPNVVTVTAINTSGSNSGSLPGTVTVFVRQNK